MGSSSHSVAPASDVVEGLDLQRLRRSVLAEVTELAREQKTSFLKDGEMFEVLSDVAGEKKVRFWKKKKKERETERDRERQRQKVNSSHIDVARLSFLI